MLLFLYFSPGYLLPLPLPLSLACKQGSLKSKRSGQQYPNLQGSEAS